MLENCSTVFMTATISALQLYEMGLRPHHIPMSMRASQNHIVKMSFIFPKSVFVECVHLILIECIQYGGGFLRVPLPTHIVGRILTGNRCTDPCSHYESRPEFLSPPAYSNKPLPWSSLLQIAAVSMLGL